VTIERHKRKIFSDRIYRSLLQFLASVIMVLLPPLETEEYDTRQCLITAVQTHAAAEGYAVMIRHSSNATKTIYLGCDRGGVYRNRNNLNDSNRQRDTASRLVGCPFSIRASEWNSVWTLKVRNSDHNHLATEVIAAHPVQCRLPSHVKKQIKDLSASGIAPSQIVSTIRQSTDHSLIAQDVYNTRKELKWENLHNKTPIEALLETLEQDTYTFYYKTDLISRITHLFFAYSKSIELLNHFPEVILLDCTYKTNRFKLPLLNIVGTTCLNTTFYIAFCFIRHEDEKGFTWALSQLQSFYCNTGPQVLIMDRDMAQLKAARVVFPKIPRMLCIWHIEKNVLVHSSQYIKDAKEREEFMKDWVNLINSPTIPVYNTRWEEFKAKYQPQYPLLLLYLEDTWLGTWKVLVVRA
jgi:hypothetical protein